MEPITLRNTPETQRLAVSIAEAARLLDVSQRTLARMVASRELPSFSVNARCRRIPLSGINEYIAERLESERSA
jgi:excisionase family DNA binding protein